ncbi:hypothetical protein M2160_004965 [Streptomyces sp. SAI-117]|nr:hypothetical protein [Streptomyces sp. SAI-117]
MFSAATDVPPSAHRLLLPSPATPVPPPPHLTVLPPPHLPVLPAPCLPPLPNTRLPNGPHSLLPNRPDPLPPKDRRPLLPKGPHPRLPDNPCRLGQGRARRHQVVDQHDQPLGQKPPAIRNDGQCAREIVQPLPGVEPRLVSHAPPLPQYRHHPSRHPRPPQFTCRRKRDPPRRIMPPGPDRPPCGRHGNEQHRHPDPWTRPPATTGRPRLWVTDPGQGRTTPEATFGSGRAHLPHSRPHSPRQSRTEWPREAQHPPLLVGQQHRPYRVRIPSRRMHHRQSGRLRHRPHPAGRGPVQGGTALRTEHRARLPAASALGRQHQIGEVLPPPPHAHHCANAEADRPPLWITACGKLNPRNEQPFAP